MKNIPSHPHASTVGPGLSNLAAVGEGQDITQTWGRTVPEVAVSTLSLNAWWDIIPYRIISSDYRLIMGVPVVLPSMEHRTTLMLLYCFWLLCSYVRDLHNTLYGS